jgi:hypothetical protein
MYPGFHRLIPAMYGFSFVVTLISRVEKHRLIYVWVHLCLRATWLAYL